MKLVDVLAITDSRTAVYIFGYNKARDREALITVANGESVYDDSFSYENVDYIAAGGIGIIDITLDLELTDEQFNEYASQWKD